MFENKLESLRKDKGLSIDQLAKELGITNEECLKYEEGKLPFSLEILNGIADLFQESTDNILNYDYRKNLLFFPLLELLLSEKDISILSPYPNKRIVTLRKKLGCTQENFAIAIGIARATYANWEKLKDLSSDQVLQIAAGLGVSIDFIIGREHTLKIEDYTDTIKKYLTP